MTQQHSHAWAKQLGKDLRIQEFSDVHPRRDDYITFMTQADEERLKLEDKVRAVVPPQAIVTGRTKSIDTLREKLIRYPTQALDKIDDVIGVRVVHEMTLDEQDLVVETLRDTFGSRTTVKDRRATPTAGYRAVHLAVRLPNLRGEVQVRTMWQARWADLFERQADTWGRGMRYGAPPDPDPFGDSTKRLAFAERLIDLSLGTIAQYEDAASQASKLRGELASMREHLKTHAPHEITDETRKAEASTDAAIREFERTLKTWSVSLDEILGTLVQIADLIP
jgi:ppGpp synthetase/RelA/SpoT-type nucleotidyltranferase